MLGPDDSMVASRLKQIMKKPFQTPSKSLFALAPAGGDEDNTDLVGRHLRNPASKDPSPDYCREQSPVSRSVPKKVPSVDGASGTGVIEIDSESDEETASGSPSTPLPPTDIELDASFSTKFPVRNSVLLAVVPY